MNCGVCYSCHHGRGNCCENLKVIGVMSVAGCERIVLPARKRAWRVRFRPSNALVETLAIGCHAVNRGAPVEGDRAGDRRGADRTSVISSRS
jgi:alcohol dehydrogenase